MVSFKEQNSPVPWRQAHPHPFPVSHVRINYNMYLYICSSFVCLVLARDGTYFCCHVKRVGCQYTVAVDAGQIYCRRSVATKILQGRLLVNSRAMTQRSSERSSHVQTWKQSQTCQHMRCLFDRRDFVGRYPFSYIWYTHDVSGCGFTSAFWCRTAWLAGWRCAVKTGKINVLNTKSRHSLHDALIQFALWNPV